MAGEKMLEKKRQEYIQKRREEILQSEEFYTKYAQADQYLEQEASEQITQENLQ